jgi:tetratricopeptide (TPR) repeat protein
VGLVAADQLTAEGNALFQEHEYVQAMARFERAAAIYPQHHQAWKGLGHCLLCLARPIEAARAFDRAIGLRPDSATALWGGALAHADLGHRIVAQNYLKRVLSLQPTWLELALSVPALASGRKRRYSWDEYVSVLSSGPRPGSGRPGRSRSAHCRRCRQRGRGTPPPREAWSCVAWFSPVLVVRESSGVRIAQGQGRTGGRRAPSGS